MRKIYRITHNNKPNNGASSIPPFKSYESTCIQQLVVVNEDISKIEINNNEFLIIFGENNNKSMLKCLNNKEILKKFINIIHFDKIDSTPLKAYENTPNTIIIYEKYLKKFYINQFPSVIIDKTDDNHEFKFIRSNSNVFYTSYSDDRNVELVLKKIEKSHDIFDIHIEMITTFIADKQLDHFIDSHKNCIFEIFPLCSHGSVVSMTLFKENETTLNSIKEDSYILSFTLKNSLHYINFKELQSTIQIPYSNIDISNLPLHICDINNNHLSTKIMDVYQVFDHIESIVHNKNNNKDKDLVDNHSNVCLCFNGGKDCTVLLNLWINYMSHKYLNWISHIQLLIICYDDTFDEIINFINSTILGYSLTKIYEVDGNQGMKQALTQFTHCYPHIDTYIIGSRYNDKFGNKLKKFIMSDDDWPKMMRVNPILDWSYHDIWEYLLHFKIPYCSLYNKGYTSLGRKSLTNKNIKLYNQHNNTYSPAYQLSDDTYERTNRL